jgi:hypothetical protein
LWPFGALADAVSTGLFFQQKSFLTIMKKISFLLPCIAFFLLFQQTIYAQSARLGIQGILKKANGNAVDDDTYQLTFKLYNATTGGTALWQETQDNVEVASGIYTATLGTVNPLNIPFNETYYLGVTVGPSSGTEMLPRIQLTTAPYALSLIGQSNQFPSSGTVKADNEVVAGKLTVGQTDLHSTSHAILANGGVLARGGAPGGSGGSNNGYAFTGNSGDNDSGLFSTADGQVSLYTNNAERLKATTTGVEIAGNLTSTTTALTVNDNLNLTTGNTLQYNGLSDWRLVDRDDFQSGSLDGWSGTTTLTGTTAAPLENVSYGTFNGSVIRPTGSSNNPVLKKQFNLSTAGTYSFVKIVFKYYFTDSWDGDDASIGGFATASAGPHVICWTQSGITYSGSGTANYTGSGTYSDAATIGEMVANTSATSFFVFFGMRSDDDTGNERYALGNVEVWVR